MNELRSQQQTETSHESVLNESRSQQQMETSHKSVPNSSKGSNTKDKRDLSVNCPN